MKTYIGDQGEVSIFKIEALPNAKFKPAERTTKGGIVSHSESGSHHILEDGELMERTDEGIAAGMKILYAIVENPTRLFQDASDAHAEHTLEPGIYEFRIAREYDAFMEQARIVAD